MNIHFIGNAHLDPAWMWRLEEGFSAFAATCRSALDRMKETDEFIFTVSSAACFEFIEKTNPHLFSQIVTAVKSGRWSLVGGWWCEPDCNLPSGESFLRQGLYGQSYFQSRFGMICDTGFCIDSFGHNVNTPMLLRECGMSNYVFMRPEQHEKSLVDSLFNWQSQSGESVLTYRIPLHYSNFELSVDQKINQLPSYPLFNNSHPWMIFYGVGNHGGGPTKEQIAQVVKICNTKEVDGKFSSPSAFFKQIRESNINIGDYRGEMQPHAIGAYSAHCQVKALNRKAESALVRAEILSVLSDQTSGILSDWSSLEEAWKLVLLNQFHDTLGGVAIKEAMDDAVLSYNEAISIATRNEQLAIARIASQMDTSDHVESLVVFNANGFALHSPIELELWHPSATEKGEHLSDVTLIDHRGRLIATQKIEASGKINGDRVRFVAEVDLPSLGWNTFGIIRNKKTEQASSLHIDEQTISNTLCKLEYTPAAVFNDLSDTWGHGVFGFNDQVGKFSVLKREVLENGPIRVRLRITSKYNNSELREDFILYNNSPIIEHRVKLDWHEKHKVCKLRYAHHLTTPEVRYEIPYGSVTRPADGNEVPVGAWAFAQEEGKGIGIIAPTKSSYSADEKYISVSIARSALFAHHEPPHKLEPSETLNYLDQGEQEFTNLIVLGASDWQSARMPHLSTQVLNPPICHIEYSHKGELPKEYSLLSIENGGIVSVLKLPYKKQSEKAVIVRINNSYEDELNLSIRYKTAILSSNIQVRGFAVKTFKITPNSVIECNALEI